MAESKFNIKCVTNKEWVVKVTSTGQHITSKKIEEAEEYNEAGAAAFITANGPQFEAVPVK